MEKNQNDTKYRSWQEVVRTATETVQQVGNEVLGAAAVAGAKKVYDKVAPKNSEKDSSS